MNTLKALFSNLLVVLVLVMGVTLLFGNHQLERRTHALAAANETNETLQSANEQQASALKVLQQEDVNLRSLLGTQDAALTRLDNQHRKTTNELQQALATPPAGRPDCAREPLPDRALRLLHPTEDRGANPGGQAAAAAGTGAALPGA